MRAITYGFAAVFAMAMPGVADAAITLTTLHDFAGSGATPPDGANPQAALISDSTGALYGTTASGGASNAGTVFKLTPSATAGNPWSESVLYGFCSQTRCGDGSVPYAGLIFGSDGALYGTTSGGGAFGGGTVFKLTPAADGSWTESVLYSFTGGNDGDLPYAGLIMDAAGALYGTTEFGGSNGAGTVFKLAPPGTVGGGWSESVLHSFTGGSGGFFPLAGLIMDASGTLYGTTRLGGNASCNGGYGCGVVFALAPPTATNPDWSESVLYSFAGGSGDGADPMAGLISDSTGALYGTTKQGGPAGAGTVFTLTPPTTTGGTWSESILYGFAGGSDGGFPLAGLISDSTGTLYGTTAGGGASGAGTVFTLTPPTTTGGAWSESTLWSFSGSDGADPSAALIAGVSGALYGTTEGGDSVNDGTIFQLVVPAVFTGVQGQPNCVGKSISPLAQKYGGISAAAAALGYASVQDMQNAIAAYCAQ